MPHYYLVTNCIYVTPLVIIDSSKNVWLTRTSTQNMNVRDKNTSHEWQCWKCGTKKTNIPRGQTQFHSGRAMPILCSVYGVFGGHSRGSSGLADRGSLLPSVVSCVSVSFDAWETEWKCTRVCAVCPYVRECMQLSLLAENMVSSLYTFFYKHTLILGSASACLAGT